MGNPRRVWYSSAMPRSRLRTQPISVRIALAALLAVLLAGGAVSVGLATRMSFGSVFDALSPEATRLRVSAPPLERAIHTTMSRHIPDPRERRELVRWMRHGARMKDYYGAPSQILARRCQTCHGASPRAGIRLLTYADALALATRTGRDPYRRLTHLHVHLFTLGGVLCLLLLGLACSRFPRRLTLAVGLTPVIALLVSVPLTIWGGGATIAWALVWACDGLVMLAWPLACALLAWDLFARAPAEDTEQ